MTHRLLPFDTKRETSASVCLSRIHILGMGAVKAVKDQHRYVHADLYTNISNTD